MAAYGRRKTSEPMDERVQREWRRRMWTSGLAGGVAALALIGGCLLLTVGAGTLVLLGAAVLGDPTPRALPQGYRLVTINGYQTAIVCESGHVVVPTYFPAAEHAWVTLVGSAGPWVGGEVRGERTGDLRGYFILSTASGQEWENLAQPDWAEKWRELTGGEPPALVAPRQYSSDP